MTEAEPRMNVDKHESESEILIRVHPCASAAKKVL